MSQLPDTTKAQDAVVEYCRRYSILPAFEMSPIYDLTPENWVNTIPFPNDAGCYFFYADDGSLLYVGKASALAGRVCKHFSTRLAFGIIEEGWLKPPRYLQTLKVREPHEAPSLEEYLIYKLQPTNNTIGRRRSGD